MEIVWGVILIVLIVIWFVFCFVAGIGFLCCCCMALVAAWMFLVGSWKLIFHSGPKSEAFQEIREAIAFCALSLVGTVVMWFALQFLGWIAIPR